MIMHGMTVIDKATGQEMTNRYLAMRQPHAAEGRYRAHLNDARFGIHPNRTMLCQFEDGRWVALEPADFDGGAAAHPDLDRFANEFIAVARDVIERLGAGYKIDINFGSEDDGDHRYRDYASPFVSRIDPHGTLLHADDPVLNLIPGMRTLDTNAVVLFSSLGIQNEEDNRQIRGDVTMTIGADFLVASYHLDDMFDVRFDLESRLADGSWIHTSSITVKDGEPDNIIEALKRERSGAEKIFKDLHEQLLFKEAFPALESGDTIPLSVEKLDDGALHFQIHPGDLKGRVSCA